MNKRTLEIAEETALKLYESSTSAFKAILEDTFGRKFFIKDITDRVKTYEDACAELDEEPLNESDLKSLGFTDDEIVYRKIKTITKALNEGWVSDWNNGNQKKWYPWFEMSSGGFVFDDAFCAYSAANAGDASRLCFKSRELAKYAGEQFTKLYSDFIL